ncbi:cupin domain-containing protein [Thalassotalea euphylliae]|uniref:cupin domain-containing protein n=1 Tax=Thalassotalea euphylliae TaxID=1655234 RepID=UPI00363453D5
MPNDVINFNEKFSQFSKHWSPKVIAEMNNYQLKLAKVEGEFVWHTHEDTDEVFIVMNGSLAIHLRDRVIQLNTGEMFVVPKGVEHKPVAQSECQILLIEPRGVVNTGQAGGKLTADNDCWI